MSRGFFHGLAATGRIASFVGQYMSEPTRDGSLLQGFAIGIVIISYLTII